MLWILACSPNSDSPRTFPAGWSLSAPLPCITPNPGWTDQSETIGIYPAIAPPNTRVNPEPGGIALLPGPQGWSLTWTRALDAPMDVSLGQTPTPRPYLSDPALGFSIADLDQDGEDDLITFGIRSYVTWSYGHPHATEQSIALPGRRLPRDATAADFDGDHQLDLFVFYSPLILDEPIAAVIYYNLGNRQFSSEISITQDPLGQTFDTQIFDFDTDGDPDIFLCHDGGTIPNQLFVNQGDGQFQQSAYPNGLDLLGFCMGIGVGDINQDGTADFYLSDLQRHNLMIGDGVSYLEVSSAWNLPGLEPDQMGWGGLLTDFDNDGATDLLVATSDFYIDQASLWPLWYFRNEGNTMVESGLFPKQATTRGLVVRDINADGVPDLLAGDAFRSPYLFLSNGCTEENWLDLYAPLHSRVEVDAGGKTWVSWVLSESSWSSAGNPVAHIGLGAINEIEQVRITPPWSETATLDGPFSARRSLIYHYE